jgi:hypothetical protein
MSPVDVLAMVKKLDQRTLAIEQILPTLATKEDLKAYPTRVEMNEKFEEAKRFALVLHEDLKSDIALIAEHLADVMTRLPRSG